MAAAEREEEMTMQVVDYIIRCEDGLHARPASALAKLAQRFPCDIRLANKETGAEADGKSILEILCLGACKDTKIDIACSGEQAGQALEEIVLLLDTMGQ